jgi:hypothetical protein
MKPVAIDALLWDICDAAPIWLITDVASSDPPGGAEPDWQVTGDHTLDLRAERGRGPLPRIYTITITAIDASGNESTATVEVTVPLAGGGGGNGNGNGNGRGADTGNGRL